MLNLSQNFMPKASWSGQNPLNGYTPGQITGRSMPSIQMPTFRPGQAPALTQGTGAMAPQPASNGMVAAPSFMNSTGAPATPQPQTISNSFWGGKTMSVPTMPADITGLRNGIIGQLGSNLGGYNAQGAPDPTQVRSGYAGDVNAQQVGTNFSVNPEIMDMFRGMMNGSMGGGGGGGGAPVNIDSVDKLGGANSEFFKNMMAQFSPAFAQRRSEGLAAAKEAAGNLTGSGFANSLGASVNRSLGDEQERLANVGMQGIGMELDRQKALAGYAAQQNAASAGAGASMHNANLNAILGMGGLDLDAQRLGLQGQTTNQDASLRAALANQSTLQGNNDLNANLEAQRQTQMYQGRNQLADSNANRYTNLLGQFGTTGVGPNEIVQQDGFGAALPGLLSAGGQFLGSKGGQQLLSGIGHGGGGASSALSMGANMAGFGLPGAAGAAANALGGSGMLSRLGGLGLGSMTSPMGLAGLGLSMFPQKTVAGQVGRAINNPIGTAAKGVKKIGSWLSKRF